MKAKDLIPASRPRNPVVRQQQTSGAGAHKDKKRAEKQGDVKHKAKQFAEGVAEGMDQDEYYNIVSAISNFKDEYGEEPSGQELFDLAYSIGVEPDDVINVMYGRVVPNKGVAEGYSDEEHPIRDDGNEGRFAGDTRVDIGGTTLRKIESGDTVSYFGEKAQVVDLDYSNNYARISANGKTLNVKLSDLKRVYRS